MLDAAPRTDAGAVHDASSMDAPRLDAPATDDSGADANENLMTFDAVVLPEDAATMDAPEADDSSVVVARDAIVIDPIADAIVSMDAAVSLDATPEVGLSGRDVGPDANTSPDAFVVPDAGGCTADTGALGCPVLLGTSGGVAQCQDTRCTGRSCTPVGPAIVCPPAGSCARCGRAPMSGAAICMREGTRCAGLGDACDVGTMQCMEGLACEPLGCAPGICLPACTPTEVGASMEIALPTLVLDGTCNGRAFVPMGFIPAWCASPGP